MNEDDVVVDLDNNDDIDVVTPPAEQHDSIPRASGDTDYEDDVVTPPDTQDDSISASGAASSASVAAVSNPNAPIVTQKLVVNLTPGGVLPVLRCSQYDDNYVVFFTVYKGNNPYEFPSDTSIRYEMTKTDGYAVSGPVTKASGTGQCYLWMDQQMTTKVGDQLCELVITSSPGGRRVGTANFIIDVEPGGINKKSIVSRDQLSYASDILNRLGNFDALNNAFTAANTKLTANVATINNKLRAAEYQRSWWWGDSISRNSWASVWRSGYVVTVSFVAYVTAEIPAGPSVGVSRAILRNLPESVQAVFITPTVIDFNSSGEPTGVRSQCVCAIRPGHPKSSDSDEKYDGTELFIDRELNPTTIRVNDRIFGTFTYITKDLNTSSS